MWRHATRARYRETLTYLLWLDQFHSAAPEWFGAVFSDACHTKADSGSSPLRWLDVGAKNWSYVGAFSAFLQCRDVHDFVLDGVELDPYRRYADLRTRRQYARVHIRDIPQARYHEGDILDWTESAHIISSFLPFVFPEPHQAWGLPARYFQPERLLEHAVSLLKPEGLLLIINQGAEEAEAQEMLLQKTKARFPLRWQAIGPLPVPFIDYQHPRYGWVCRRVAT